MENPAGQEAGTINRHKPPAPKARRVPLPRGAEITLINNKKAEGKTGTSGI